MGDTFYFMKIWLHDREKATECQNYMNDLFDELNLLEGETEDVEFASRMHMINSVPQRPRTLDELRENYPHVAEMMQLLGLIDIKALPDTGNDWYFDTDYDDMTVKVSAEIRSSADWDLFTDFARKKWNVKAMWLDEENIDPFDALREDEAE